MLLLHTVSGILALIFGLATCVLVKGTPLHRRVGWIYSGSMYTLCLSSFLISADILTFVEVAGMHYGIFHVFALWGTLQLSVGLYVMIRRAEIDNAVHWHLYNMLWSVVGLVMATNSHLFRYVAPWITQQLQVPMGWGIGITGVLLWGVPATIGTIWIERIRPRYLDENLDEAPDAVRQAAA
jgi:uncharacterized membrane protein